MHFEGTRVNNFIEKELGDQVELEGDIAQGPGEKSPNNLTHDKEYEENVDELNG